MTKHTSVTRASVNPPISHGKKRRPTFINIGPGGFCQCNNARGARSKPEGTIALCLALLAYPFRPASMPDDHDFIYTKGNGKIYATYDFLIPEYGLDEPIASMEILLGELSDWPNNISPNVELLQLINSAANTFPWDESPGAASERAYACEFNFGKVALINSVVVMIELGKDSDCDYQNSVKRIVQPGDPEFEQVIEFESPCLVGTGHAAKHVPPKLRSSP